MPTLKNLSCQIRWADTDAPLQEYGTQYGDGVVETYVVVPDKPQRFYIRLTSKGFVHEGLAAIVFMDGTYQCNRNRVNLVPAKKGRPRERSEIDFVMRQKEKTIGEGLYMGRQWRFDNHNIVPDPPKMSEGDHFKFLGTIEVVVLRCCARSVDDCGASDISSAAESQILETALRGRPDSPVNRQNTTSPAKCPGKGKAVESEDDPIGGLFGLFDGAADPPIPRYHYHEGPPTRHGYGDQGCHRCHQHVHHDSSMPFGPQPAPRPSGPTKRVHFDYGPSRSHLQPQTMPSTAGWADRYSDVLPDHPNPSYYNNGYQHNTPGLSEYQPTSQSTTFHPPPQPVHHNPPVPGHGSTASRDVRFPGVHFHCPPAPPPRHFHIPANHLDAMPNSNPAYPAHPTHPLQPPQGTGSSTYVARFPPHAPLPLPDTLVPRYHMHPPSYWPPPQYHYPPPGQKVPDLAGQRKSSGSTISSKSGRRSSKASSLGSTKDKKNPSSDWSNQIADNSDARDDWQYQNPNNSEAQDWCNEMPREGGEEQRNDNDFQNPDTTGEILSGIQDSHQGSEMNNTTAAGNSYSGANDSSGNNYYPTDGPRFGGVDGTSHSGTNPTQNYPANIGPTVYSSSISRPLYGPHGTYFAMQSPTALDAPCDAEEEPRYDVPQSYVDSYGTTKQVQPGKGYLYAKKRYSPKYIDDLNDPYARFVFIYRTKEQLKKDFNMTLDAEPTGDEEIQKLQNVSKDELIQMLLRAQLALGGKVPSPLAPDIASSSTRAVDLSEPITFEPPDAAHLDYHIPEQRPAVGTASDAVGRGSSNDGASASNTGEVCGNPSGAIPGDMKQQYWETNNNETPLVQAGSDPTDNQGISWGNDYQIPTQNEDPNNQQIGEAVDNDRNSNLDQQMTWQSNRASSEENLNRRDGSKCSTRSSRRGHDASPDREFSAPLIAEETEEPTQQPKGGQNPPPQPLPTSHGRWVLTPQGLLWQSSAYPSPQPPAYFGYGPHTPFYGPPLGYHYQQYPSVRPAPEPQPVNRSQSPPQKSKSPTSDTPGRHPRARDSATRSSSSTDRQKDQGTRTTRRKVQKANQQSGDTSKSYHDFPQQRPQSGRSSDNWSSQQSSQQSQLWQDQQPSMGEAPKPEGGW